jgi:hypothetical protein
MFNKKPTKQEREMVEFISSEDMKFIASRLNEKSFEAIDEIIDRYIDYKMKELIKAKINEERFDENLEIKMRGILEFKQFLSELH